MGDMRSSEGFSADTAAAELDSFATLLLNSGLATAAQLSGAAAEADQHFDEQLLESGVVDAARLRVVMSVAWHLPVADLAAGWIDRDLVCSLSGETYLDGRWMPLRDQANGSVLVATARYPDAERAADISDQLASPVEFAVATAVDIRSAVLDAWGRNARR